MTNSPRNADLLTWKMIQMWPRLFNFVLIYSYCSSTSSTIINLKWQNSKLFQRLLCHSYCKQLELLPHSTRPLTSFSSTCNHQQTFFQKTSNTKCTGAIFPHRICLTSDQCKISSYSPVICQGEGIYLYYSWVIISILDIIVLPSSQSWAILISKILNIYHKFVIILSILYEGLPYFTS